jgi:hypothetical protein
MARRRRKGSKATAQHFHAIGRFSSRYDMDLDAELKHDLIGLVQGKLSSTGEIVFSDKQSNRVTDFVIKREGEHIRFLYDKQRKTIVSALPLGDYERFLEN